MKLIQLIIEGNEIKILILYQEVWHYFVK